MDVFNDNPFAKDTPVQWDGSAIGQLIETNRIRGKIKMQTGISY